MKSQVREKKKKCFLLGLPFYKFLFWYLPLLLNGFNLLFFAGWDGKHLQGEG